jgi:acetyltransferase-like isoleucine patch superfamily enzyme
MANPRTIPGDWYEGQIPEAVDLAPDVYVESAYSFKFCRAAVHGAVSVGSGTSVYLGSMFDVGPGGRVDVGKYTLLNGAWITSDMGVAIGDYTLISWRVAIMDNYRVPFDPARRRLLLEEMARDKLLRLELASSAQAVKIGSNVWIGFDVCVLPGVTIGDGSIIGAKSVVAEDVPPYSVAAGNPARIVKQLEMVEVHHEQLDKIKR